MISDTGMADRREFVMSAEPVHDAEGAVWRFAHGVATAAARRFAWDFWTDVRRWAVVDDDIVSVQLTGGAGFAVGAQGMTITAGGRSVARWEVVEVVQPTAARIRFPAPGAALDARWTFDSRHGGGCWITQELVLHGPRADDYRSEVASGMAAGVPKGMAALARAIDGAFVTD